MTDRTRFRVRAERCDECLFSPGRIVDARRMGQVLDECDRMDTYFVCHKATLAGRDDCCRGFYDREPYANPLMRLAAMLGRVAFVDGDGEIIEDGGAK